MWRTAVLLLVLLQLLAKKPAAPIFPLGKETTYVTGPLDEEGYIDYEVALNRRLRQGITPQTNANVLIWKALGPRPEGKAMPPRFYGWLGIDTLPDRGDYFIGLQPYLRVNLRLDGDDWETAFNQHTPAVQRPWTAKDYPHLAGWLQANEKPLALVVEATRRPHYYNPLVAPRNVNGKGSLLGALLPSTQRCRELNLALALRAQLHMGAGDFNAAWQDLLACHRLARLVARGGSLMESLVGIANEAIASEVDVVWLDRAKPTAQQARDCLRDLQQLPPFPLVADKMDFKERLTFLEILQLVRRHGGGVLNSLDKDWLPPRPEPLEALALEATDWELALRNMNGWFDRIVAALRVTDRAEREKELDQIHEDLKALKEEVMEAGGLASLRKEGNPVKAVGKKISDVLVALLVPAFRKVQNSAYRAEQRQANLHVAFALAAYRADHGRYPATLGELAPMYLASVPGDLFSGKPLIYRVAADGYLLYSVGENGKDDRGRGYDDDPPADDLHVRLPLPELKPKQ